MHIHLDTVGGISGNMFIGAILDAFPQWAEELPQQLRLAGFGDLVDLQLKAQNDGVLTGTFFNVTLMKDNNNEHRHYCLIRDTIARSSLSDSVKNHTLGIFRGLAEAEATVHGTSVEQVSFHEVGAWDSIADVVCSAYLIDCLSQHPLSKQQGCTWSVSALPLGSGLVNSAHGPLPVPAPAVTLLLKNFIFYRDAIEGERVTPTGAAILHYLIKEYPGDSQLLHLNSTGYGFGCHRFPGISNVLRVLVFNSAEVKQQWQEQIIAQINFEVDDQSAEDIAEALMCLRLVKGVFDVNQFPVFAKKGRVATSIQVLCETNELDEVTAACFNQTNTVGLRKQIVSRAVLPRKESTIDYQDQKFQIKQVSRPNGTITQKLEMDDLARATDSQLQRQILRATLEVDKNNDS